MSFFRSRKNWCEECEECSSLVFKEAAIYHTESLEKLIGNVISGFVTEIDACEDKCLKCQSHGKTRDSRAVGYDLYPILNEAKAKAINLREDIQNFQDSNELRENHVDPFLVDKIARGLAVKVEEDNSLRRAMDKAEATLRTADAVRNIEEKERQTVRLKQLAEQQFEEDMKNAPASSRREGDLLDSRIYDVLSNWRFLDNPHRDLNEAYREVTGRQMDPRVGAAIVKKYVR